MCFNFNLVLINGTALLWLVVGLGCVHSEQMCIGLKITMNRCNGSQCGGWAPSEVTELQEKGCRAIFIYICVIMEKLYWFTLENVLFFLTLLVVCSPYPESRKFLLYARQIEIRGVDIDNPYYNYIISFTVPDIDNVTAVDYDAVEHRIYWSDVRTQTIKRAFINGTGVETVVSAGKDVFFSVKFHV